MSLEERNKYLVGDESEEDDDQGYLRKQTYCVCGPLMLACVHAGATAAAKQLFK